MWELLHRFADVVRTKLARVSEYLTSHQPGPDEWLVHTLTRETLAWALRLMSRWLAKHPYLDPDVLTFATQNLDRMARDLFNHSYPQRTAHA